MIGLGLAVCQERGGRFQPEIAKGEQLKGGEKSWGRRGLLDFNWRPVREPRI
jgi:hypothetical protein